MNFIDYFKDGAKAFCTFCGGYVNKNNQTKDKSGSNCHKNCLKIVEGEIKIDPITVEIHLGYYKQGTDFNSSIRGKNTGTNEVVLDLPATFKHQVDLFEKRKQHVLKFYEFFNIC